MRGERGPNDPECIAPVSGGDRRMRAPCLVHSWPGNDHNSAEIVDGCLGTRGSCADFLPGIAEKKTEKVCNRVNTGYGFYLFGLYCRCPCRINEISFIALDEARRGNITSTDSGAAVTFAPEGFQELTGGGESNNN